MNPVAQAAEDAGRKLSGANSANLAGQLNAAIGEFLGWPYIGTIPPPTEPCCS